MLVLRRWSLPTDKAMFGFHLEVQNGRISIGALVVHERAKKVLAPAHHYLRCSVGEPNRLHVGIGCGSFYLHAVLRVSSQR
jgi:hypothetical protein